MAGVVPIRDDFPDWGAAPSSLTYNPIAYTCGSAFTEIARFDMSNYQYGVIYIAYGGTIVDNNLTFDWMGTVGAEGTTLTAQPFARLSNGLIVIPFQAMSPTFRVTDNSSSVYPYGISIGATLLTSSPYQHGFPGGLFAINDPSDISMGDTRQYFPLGCGPGEHIVSIGTTSTSWDMSLLIYPKYDTPIRLVLATAQSGNFVNYGITLPATQWILEITNNDADAQFVATVARTPDPT